MSMVEDNEGVAARAQSIERRGPVQRRRIDLIGIVDVEDAGQDVHLAAPGPVERPHRVAVEIEHDLVDADRRAPVLRDALETDTLAPLPAAEAERSGADRLPHDR